MESVVVAETNVAEKRTALVAPADGVVGILNDDGSAVTICGPRAVAGEALPIDVFTTRYPATASYEVAATEDAERLLRVYQECSRALEFVLFLFDPDISVETKEKIADQLNSLLSIDAVADYALNVLYAFPLAEAATVATALEVSRGYEVTWSTIKDFSQSQPRIRIVYDAWLKVRNLEVVQRIGTGPSLGLLARYGVFRRLVANGSHCTSLVSVYSEDELSELRKQRILGVVTELVNEYIEGSLASGAGKKEGTYVQERMINTRSAVAWDVQVAVAAEAFKTTTDQDISSSTEFFRLISQVRAGSQDAAWELVARYGRDVQRFVRRTLHQRMRSKFDSLDFVQIVWGSFFRAPERLEGMERSDQLIGYLATLAKFKVITEVRRRLETDKYDITRDNVAGDSYLSPDQSSGPLPTASAVAIAKERWEQLLAGETDQVRKIVELRLQGTTYDEIANQLGIHERTARKTIKRLLRKSA